MRFNLDGLQVFFPYDFMYPEQYAYMLEMKRALDAKGHGLLEMPTGTGKTVCCLSLVTSYQHAHPELGKLIYCTRTVPEMTKCVQELKRVIAYRDRELGLSDASNACASAGDVYDSGSSTKSTSTFLALCLSSRRNMCINEKVMSTDSDRDAVDSKCRDLTASW
jgi:DNA excision repair protein ERCC-2